MGLTKQIQLALQNIKENPAHHRARDWYIPASLVAEIIEEIEGWGLHGEYYLDDAKEIVIEISSLKQCLLLPSNFLYNINTFFRLAAETNIEQYSDRLILRPFICTYLQDFTCSYQFRHRREGTLEHLRGGDYSLAEYLMGKIDRFTSWHLDYELNYALHNHLCAYVDGQWSLTAIGNAFLRLPEIQGTRFLLALERFLYQGLVDEFRISNKFLADIVGKESWQPAQIENDSYGVEIEYAHRLEQFGLLERIRVGNQESMVFFSAKATEQQFTPPNAPTYHLTGLGKVIVESVQAHDSAFDLLVPLYVSEDVNGAGLPDYISSKRDLERVSAIVKHSPLLGDLRQPILEEISRLEAVNAAYLSIFTALAPKIEGLLKNICKIEGIPEAEKLGFKDVIIKIREHQKVRQRIYLKESTLETIDNLLRPNRNTVEHGRVLQTEPARMMCDLALWIIENIHRDYNEYKD